MRIKLFSIANTGYVQMHELYSTKELALIGMQLKSLYTVNTSKFSLVEITLESDSYMELNVKVNTKESLIKDIEDYHSRIAVFNKNIIPKLIEELCLL